MGRMDQDLLRDWADADAQGYRLAITIWPGDQVYLGEEFREVVSLHPHSELEGCLWINTSLEGARKSYVRPRFHPLLVLLSEHHANQEM